MLFACNRRTFPREKTYLHRTVHVLPHFDLFHVRPFLLLAYQKFVPHLNRQPVPSAAICQILWRFLYFHMRCSIHESIRRRVSLSGTVAILRIHSIRLVHSMVAVNHRIHNGILVCGVARVLFVSSRGFSFENAILSNFVSRAAIRFK